MTEIVDRSSPPSTAGKIFHWAMAYDLLLRVFWGRSEQRYRDKVVHLAGLTSGESVLDVGCGTGTLAMTAKWHVGQRGKVIGVDASPEMIARARRKAARAALDLDFQTAAAEALRPRCDPDHELDSVDPQRLGSSPRSSGGILLLDLP